MARKLEAGINDLATIHPHLVAEWDYEKNYPLTPQDVLSGSHKKVFWKCSKGHEWDTTVKHRALRGQGCPSCAGKRKLTDGSSLEVTHPHLLDEWDYEKNIDILPKEVLSGSQKKAWWRCKGGHSWYACISQRANGSGCPYCVGQKILAGYNDLATTHPYLVAEWDYEKNYPLTPQDVSKGMSKKVWWVCKDKHSWCTMISTKVRGCSCTVCADLVKRNKAALRIKKPKDTLIITHPLLAKEWHHTKNLPLTPEEVTYGENRKVWWQCEKGHEWEATLNNRTSNKSNCPICANQQLLIGYNDLATLRPDIAKQWDYVKNHPLRPEDFMVGSSKQKVYWECDVCNHKWFSSPNCRTQKKWNYCPNCVKGRHTSFAEQFIYFCMKELYSDTESRAKLDGKEADVYIPTLELVIEYDGHRGHSSDESKFRDAQKTLHFNQLEKVLLRIKEVEKAKSIYIEDGVIYTKVPRSNLKILTELMQLVVCWINKQYSLDLQLIIPTDIETKIIEQLQILDKENSLEIKYPKIAVELHPIKNGVIRADSIASKSNHKVWWLCPKCGNDYQMVVANRTGRGGRNCPYCYGHKIKIGFNDLETTHTYLLNEWDFDKNDITPKEVTAGTGKKVYWKCHTCNYSYKAPICNRTGQKNPTGCPLCSGNIVKEGVNDLTTTAPEILIDWAYDLNTIRPNEVSKGSGRRVLWRCHNCGVEWGSNVANRVARGYLGCKNCRVPI